LNPNASGETLMVPENSGQTTTMRNFEQSPPAAVLSPRAAAPGSWQDLKRDWQRWSRAERIAAEILLGAMLLGAVLSLASMHLS
jgi:hypothetical protein